MAKRSDKEMATFLKKYRAGDATAADRPGATEFTIEGETAPVTMTSRKRAADNAAGVNKPRANPAPPAPGVGGIPFDVDTSNPPEPPVQGNRMPATSKAARKKGRENVLEARAKKIVAQEARDKKKAAERAASADPAAVPPAVEPTGGSGSSAAKGGRRASAKELARKAQAQANREARQKAKAGVQEAAVAGQNAKAEELLTAAKGTTGKKSTKFNRNVTRAQETLGLLGNKNPDNASVRSPDRKSPYGRPLQTRTTAEEQAAIDAKVEKAKSPATREKHRSREEVLARRNERDRKTLVESGLADSPIIANERGKLEQGLRSMRISADPRSDLAGVSEASLRDMQQTAAARAGIREIMSPSLHKAPSISKSEGEGMLGGLHLRIRNSSDIPRVKPNPISTETEIRPIQENGLRKEGVAVRYQNQQERKRKIKATIAHNQTAPEDEQKTVPSGLSGRTDKAPVPIEHLPTEWSVETARVPGKKGTGKPASIEVASGSDVVQYTVPDPQKMLSEIGGTMRPSPAAIEQLKTATALRAGGAHNLKASATPKMVKKASYTGDSVPMPQDNRLVQAGEVAAKRNRADLVGLDVARIARNDRFTGEERHAFVGPELESGFNEFPSTRKSAFDALKTAGMDSYGNTRNSGQSPALGTNARTVFGAMAASSDAKAIGQQVAASLPPRPSAGSSTAKIQRKGQYVTETG